jgi:hypothetical protein
VQAVDGHLGGGDAACQLEARHDLSQLALAVGAGAAVGPLEHQVVKVERVLSEGRHLDDASRRRGPEQRQQFQGEEEPGEVVHGEAQLVSAGARPPGRPVSLAGVDAPHC